MEGLQGSGLRSGESGPSYCWSPSRSETGNRETRPRAAHGVAARDARVRRGRSGSLELRGPRRKSPALVLGSIVEQVVEALPERAPRLSRWQWQPPRVRGVADRREVPLVPPPQKALARARRSQ